MATDAIDALDRRLADDLSPEALSLYGAMHLVLAALAGFNSDRSAAQTALNEAERLADLVEEGRNVYDTEFGPSNVRTHRVSIAVDLGDAGEAIDVATHLDTTHLSPERQMRVLLDKARAFVQRRQFDAAIDALLLSERTASEHFRSHTVAHQTIEELLDRTGADGHEDVVTLAQRVGLREP